MDCCLKREIRCLGSLMNYQRPTFFSEVEKLWHMIVLGALKNSIIALKPSKCSCGLVDSSFYSKLVRDLKLGGIGASITSNVNGWLLSSFSG